jgi:DNA-directed RNA polymerase specialized sigma24 family protein
MSNTHVPEDRLIEIFHILQKKAGIFTRPDDIDDFVSDAYIGIIEQTKQGKINWDERNDMWIAIRGIYIARRKRGRERRRKSYSHTLELENFIDYLSDRADGDRPIHCDIPLDAFATADERDTYWHEIEDLANQLPENLADLFGHIVAGVVETGEADLSRDGAIRPTWLSRDTGIPLSTTRRRIQSLRLNFAPLASPSMLAAS